MGLFSRLSREGGETLDMMGGNAVLGGALGGIAGATASGKDYQQGGSPDVLSNILTGAAFGGGGAAGVAGLGGAKRMIGMIMEALKRQHPEAPDELLLTEAMKIMKQQGGDF